MFMVNFVDYAPCDLNYALHLLKGLVARAKRGPAGTTLANYDVIHSAFFKCRDEILQFYSFVTRGKTLSREELDQIRNYTLNNKQRREMRSLLSGINMRVGLSEWNGGGGRWGFSKI